MTEFKIENTSKWKSEFVHWITLEPEITHDNVRRMGLDFMRDGKLHNIEFPASIDILDDGDHWYTYYENDTVTRRDGLPASIIRNKYGKITQLDYLINGDYHIQCNPTLEECLNPMSTKGACSLEFYDNGMISEKSYRMYNEGIVSTLNNLIPYNIAFRKNGKIKCLRYNFIKREDVPPEWEYTSIEYYKSGAIKSMEYVIDNENRD